MKVKLLPESEKKDFHKRMRLKNAIGLWLDIVSKREKKSENKIIDDVFDYAMKEDEQKKGAFYHPDIKE